MPSALSKLMNLSSETPPAELADACAQRYQAVLRRASGGDAKAQRELVMLRVAYLNWAYIRQNVGAQQLQYEAGHHEK